LEPANMGALTVRMSLRGQELSLALTAETQSALDAITAERTSLEAALKSAGYSLDELKIHRADLEQIRTQAQDQFARGDSANRSNSTGTGDQHADTSGTDQRRGNPERSGGKQDSDREDESSKRGEDLGQSAARAVVV